MPEETRGSVTGYSRLRAACACAGALPIRRLPHVAWAWCARCSFLPCLLERPEASAWEVVTAAAGCFADDDNLAATCVSRLIGDDQACGVVEACAHNICSTPQEGCTGAGWHRCKKQRQLLTHCIACSSPS